MEALYYHQHEACVNRLLIQSRVCNKAPPPSRIQTCEQHRDHIIAYTHAIQTQIIRGRKRATASSHLSSMTGAMQLGSGAARAALREANHRSLALSW